MSVLVRRFRFPTTYRHVVCLPLDEGPGPEMRPLKMSEKHPGYTVVRCTRCGRIALFPQGDHDTVPCQEVT